MFTWDHTSVLRWRRDKRGLLWSGGLAGLSNTPNKPAFAFCREVCFDKTAHVAKHVWRHELGHLCALLLSFQYFLMKRNLNKKQNTETAHYLLIWKCCSRPGRYASVVCSSKHFGLANQSSLSSTILFGLYQNSILLVLTLLKPQRALF